MTEGNPFIELDPRPDLTADPFLRHVIAEAVDTSPIGVAILDASRAVLWVNRTLEEFFGLPLRTMARGGPSADVFARVKAVLEDPEALSTPVRMCGNGKSAPDAFECHVLPGAGRQERWLEGWVRPILHGPYAGGQIHRFVDITGRKRAEEALRASEQRFRQLAENASDVIYRYRLVPVRRFEYVSPSVTTLTGYPPEAFYANPELTRAFVHADDWPIIEAEQRDCTVSAAPLTFRCVHRDGKMIWVERRCMPVTDETGAVVAVDAIVRDVTERVLAQRALEQRVEERTREIERRRRVAEGLREMLAVLNSPRAWNEILDHIVGQAIRLLDCAAVAVYRLVTPDGPLRILAARGLDPEYVANVEFPLGLPAVGQAVSEQRPVTMPDAPAFLASVIEQLDPQQQALLTRLTRRLGAVLAVPLGVKGQRYGAIVVYYPAPREIGEEDIQLAVTFAEHAALAIENAKLRAGAERAAAASERERLARDLHDSVTQTLFSASLIADVLPRLWERDPEHGQRRLHELRRLARGALAEMRALLLELRPAALTEVGLGELLKQLGEAVAGRTEVAVSVDVEDTGPLPADAQIALYRIAQEALNNSVKHGGGRSARVTLSRTSTGVHVSIADDGTGFDGERVSPEHLGLKIMRERARSVGAEFAIASAPGRGTRIDVHWPAEAAEAKP